MIEILVAAAIFLACLGLIFSEKINRTIAAFAGAVLMVGAGKILLYQSGVADAEAIDKAMKLGAGHPMGPLALLDMIGLDIHRAKMQTLFEKLGDARYKHPPVVDELIAKGHLGRKTGKGFYDYSTEK